MRCGAITRLATHSSALHKTVIFEKMDEPLTLRELSLSFPFSRTIFCGLISHLPAFGSHPMGWRWPSFGAAQQFCLTRVGQESSFCRAAWIKVGEAARRQEVGVGAREGCGPAPPICLLLDWSGGATVCPGVDGEGVTHAAWGGV